MRNESIAVCAVASKSIEKEFGRKLREHLTMYGLIYTHIPHVVHVYYQVLCDRLLIRQLSSADKYDGAYIDDEDEATCCTVQGFSNDPGQLIDVISLGERDRL